MSIAYKVGGFAFLLCFSAVAAHAADQISQADIEIWNRTTSDFVATSSQPASWTVTAITPGGISYSNSDTNTVHFTGPWRTNVSITLSYRDAATHKYGCDFVMYLSYNGSNGVVDNYYINRYAYQVISGGSSVTCATVTGGSLYAYNTGANFGGLFIIK